MAIPDFQTLMLPVLRLAAIRPVNTAQAVAHVSAEFGLSDDDRREMLPSGRQSRLANRVQWDFQYLVKAGLLKRESRGVYGITDAGRQVLAENPPRIDIHFLKARSENFRQFREGSATPAEGESVEPGAQPREAEEDTPEERIEGAFKDYNAALQSDIKERVQALNDTQFEQLIVKLMLGLGYGEAGSGKRTGGTGDGAIDGVITEDVLGLDKIYLQAKRYSPDSAIGPDKIREFAGAMDAHGILKGVFVTTSRYTKAAKEYAERSHKHLRLIAGDELAEIMVQHGIGVRGERKLELKRVDEDFFENLGE